MQPKPRSGGPSNVLEPSGWVDLTRHAAGHGFPGPVCMTHQAWMDAVYFVDDLGDRLDPIRENWRLGRVLEELSHAMGGRIEAGMAAEFTLVLREGFDRLRSLSLPSARLHVCIENASGLPEVWVDVDGSSSAGQHELDRQH